MRPGAPALGSELGPGDLLWAHLDGERAGAVTAVLGARDPLALAEGLRELDLFQRAVQGRRWVRAAAPEVARSTSDREALEHAQGVELDLGSRTTALVAGPGVLVVKLHHALGDGRTLVNTVLGVAGQDAPERNRRQVKVRQVVRAAGELLRHTKGRVGVAQGERDVRLLEPRALADLKARASARGLSLNEFFLEALDDAFEANGLDRTSVGSLVELAGWGQNRFGLVLGHLDAVRSLTAVRSAEHAAASATAIALAGRTGSWAVRVVVGVLSKRIDVLASNVRGPGAPVTIGGEEVTSMAFLTPLVGKVPVSASFLSYVGQARLALVVDRGAKVDVDDLTRALEVALGAREAMLEAPL